MNTSFLTNAVSQPLLIEANSNTLTTNPTRKRKHTKSNRRTTSVKVETGTLSPHQQQHESGPTLAIKQRQVAKKKRNDVGPSAPRQNHRKVTEAERVMALQSSLPTAVIGQTHTQPSRDNLVSCAINNIQVEQGTSGIQDLSHQNSFIPPVTVSYKEALEYFDRKQYNALLEVLDSEAYALEILEAATQLLETCKHREIKVKPTLFRMLKFHTFDEHYRDLKTFFEKSNVFFAALNKDLSRDTSCLTSMLNKSDKNTINKISKTFINKTDDDVRYIAQSPYLKQISSMHNSGREKGFPVKTKVELFVASDCWKVDGQSSIELLRIISSMHRGKGLPNQAAVKDCLAWECWKVGGKFSLKLLRAFSSMYNGRGLPNRQDVENYLAWDCWKLNNEFSFELMRAFSSMYIPKACPTDRM